MARFILFQPDELKMIKVNPRWDRETLFKQEGLAFLKDVAKILDLDTVLLFGRGPSPFPKGHQ